MLRVLLKVTCGLVSADRRTDSIILIEPLFAGPDATQVADAGLDDAAGLAPGSRPTVVPPAGPGWLARPGALILMLGAAGLCALLAEGAAADWSAVVSGCEAA